ncbi:MAG: DUF1559 domain-containing protein [Planctomycetota bacterium]
MSGDTKHSGLKPSPGFRFGLWSLFYVVTLIATGLSIDTWSLIPSAVILLIWLIVYSAREAATGIFLFAVFTFLICAPCFVGSLKGPAGRSDAIIGTYNLRQISVGFASYEADNGSFPPANVPGDEPGLKHSWRVMLLPYIGEKALFDRYRFDEPWDSPHNSKLIPEIPYLFQSPESPRAGLTKAKLVVGPGTAFESDSGIRFPDISDGLSTSLLVVEDYRNPVPWTKPEDLTLEQAVALLCETDPSEFNHYSNGLWREYCWGSAIVFFDGGIISSVHNADPSVVRQLCLASDGLPGELPDLNRGPVVRLNQGAIVASIVYVLLTILPAFFIPRRRNS